MFLPMISIAQEETDNNISYGSNDLAEINRKLENPMTSLWSLVFQENFSLNNGESVDGTIKSKTIRIGKTPVKMRIEPQYSIIRPKDYGTAWNIRIQIAPVIRSPFM